MLEGWGDRMSFPKSVFPILLFVGTAASVTDHVGSVPDIATIIETAEPAPAKLGPYKKASDRLRRICVGTWSADKRIANTAFWDTKTDRLAEADGRRYVNLQFDESLNCVELLNGAKNSN